MHCGKIRLQKREADIFILFFYSLEEKNEILRPDETNNVY